MIQRFEHRDIKWIDLEGPSTEEVRGIMAEFGINELVGQELLSPTIRSKVDLYDNFIYLILHLPNTNGKTEAQEIDIVLGKDFLITTRYEEIDPLLEFSRNFEAESILNRNKMGDHAGYLLFYMLRTIYHSLMEKIDWMESDIKVIEAKIFEGHERHMVRSLSNQARLLLNFKLATDNHESVLESLETASKRLFGDGFDYYVRSIIGEFKKVRSAITTQRAYISELRETNDSLLNSKQNEIMKIFTILAFMTFPLALLIDILGIPSEHNPILGNPNDFWIIVIMTIIILLGMLVYFKKKDWL